MKEYYIIKIQFNRKSYYCIWYTNDIDGIVMEGNHIIYSDSLLELKKYCEKKGIILGIGISEYNIDDLLEWLYSSKEMIDYKIILNFWNLMSDFANTVNEYFYGDDGETTSIYNKIFAGNNLLNKSEKKYVPILSDEETMQISKVLLSGVDILKRCLNI